MTLVLLGATMGLTVAVVLLGLAILGDIRAGHWRRCAERERRAAEYWRRRAVEAERQVTA